MLDIMIRRYVFWSIFLISYLVMNLLNLSNQNPMKINITENVMEYMIEN